MHESNESRRPNVADITPSGIWTRTVWDVSIDVGTEFKALTNPDLQRGKVEVAQLRGRGLWPPVAQVDPRGTTMKPEDVVCVTARRGWHSIDLGLSVLPIFLGWKALWTFKRVAVVSVHKAVMLLANP